MATLDDVRAIALDLPDVVERVDGHRGGATWRTQAGAFVWQRGPSRRDLEQLDALGRSWPAGDIVGVRTDGLQVKEALLETYPDAFFTIPHFDGFPAVLVRLDAVAADHLREVITDAWLLKVTKRVGREWLESHPPSA
ncbi:MmcQ/YjbR family DNA-binding protein [Microbacterium sp. NPDC056736]|uniref:MmcQ/YjbR family DNA-binding protein n=1 Tax=Microbacterium sp. NPDC056736 TaxID=3345932 RepID=UPI00366AE28A